MVWINGPFGVGKTTTAQALVAADDGLTLFDPEAVGARLIADGARIPVADFQDLPAWRRLVPPAATDHAVRTGRRLVAVQSVLVERYWDELLDGLQAQRLGPVVHVVLTATTQVLRQRIDTDRTLSPSAQDFRRRRVADAVAAHAWLVRRADVVLDTTDRPPVEVAALATAAVITARTKRP